MSKGKVLVSYRDGGRCEKAVVANAKAHFLSTGKFAGSEKLACEIMQLCIDREYPFRYASSFDGVTVVSITRG